MIFILFKFIIIPICKAFIQHIVVLSHSINILPVKSEFLITNIDKSLASFIISLSSMNKISLIRRTTIRCNEVQIKIFKILLRYNIKFRIIVGIINLIDSLQYNKSRRLILCAFV